MKKGKEDEIIEMIVESEDQMWKLYILYEYIDFCFFLIFPLICQICERLV